MTARRARTRRTDDPTARVRTFLVDHARHTGAGGVRVMRVRARTVAEAKAIAKRRGASSIIGVREP